MAYKLTKEKALTFLFDTLTADNLESLAKGKGFQESARTRRLRKALNESQLLDYRNNAVGTSASEIMRKAIRIYCNTHKDRFNMDLALSYAISKNGINAVIDTMDRFVRLFVDSLNCAILKQEKTTTTFKVSDAKKLFGICGSLSKTAKFFGVPDDLMCRALKGAGVKVEQPTTEQPTTEQPTTEQPTK